MKLVIEDNVKCELFINIFQNTKAFSDTFTINIREDAFYIQGMDASHISIFEILLSREWFTKFEFEKEHSIGVSNAIFPKLLSTWTSDHRITLQHSNADKLDISFEKITGNSEYNKYFEMPLVEIEEELMHIPEQEYTIDIEFDSRKLKKLIDELMIIGETANITCNESEINAKTESIEGSMKINIPFDDIEAYSIEEGEIIDVNYSLKYIKNMCLFSKISPTVNLHITNGTPMQLKYDMENDSYVRFYLAPQMEE